LRRPIGSAGLQPSSSLIRRNYGAQGGLPPRAV